MVKTALLEGRITVNNPAIWRPILSVEDAVTAYVRSVEADEEVSGIFNIASGSRMSVAGLISWFQTLLEKVWAARAILARK